MGVSLSTMTTNENTVILNLKDPITNVDGSPAKDGSNETRSQEELAKLNQKQILASWPDLTIGQTLLGLINSKKPETVEEMSKYSVLLAKIQNKMQTAKGEWHIEKQELLGLQDVFKKADPKTLNVNLHGQVYNKIQDLLIKSTV